MKNSFTAILFILVIALYVVVLVLAVEISEIPEIERTTPTEPVLEQIEGSQYIITGYNCTGECLMANGEVPHVGSIACPPEMEFGQRVTIGNLGEYECKDRGGAIKGKRLDIYVDNIEDAYNLTGYYNVIVL